MNPYLVVDDFERTIAEYAGAKYGVAVESGTAAILLSCARRLVETVRIPKLTYPSVPCSIIHAGGRVKFTNEKWAGVYRLKPYDIIDGALRFKANMYEGGLHCLSFHSKKHLAIGRGGMILTDSELDYRWLKKARFDGRSECSLSDDNIVMIGWNMYLTPEQAARGLVLFDFIKNKSLRDISVATQGYSDLSKVIAYKRGF